MNKTLNKNVENEFEDEEIFDDSTFLANFDNTAFKETSFTDKNSNISSLNISALCCDEEISGYDRLTGKTWIYPTNYPVRDYQFNIIRAAILKNTLVSLPTGLGKTFIAAVIMYNFYRWYPLGKIVFTAPTRPLVAQQIEACYNIVALPPKDTIEMTGHMQVSTRKLHWQSKRVFFATPQVIYNDIKSGICPGDKLRCLVIDEAHRARGNYAYCQIVSTLTDMGLKTYRILALSATPGSRVDDVVNVVKNLNIAHLELRTENCIDVAPYSHSRKINTVIIQLGPELTQLREKYVEILDCYARRLKQFNILPQNLGNLSKGRVVMMYKEFQSKDRGSRHPQHNIIMKDFTLLIALYHGLELLVKHGSRVFLNFFDEHPEKSWIQSDDNLTSLLERLRDDLGVNPLSLDRSILPDGTVPEIPQCLRFGHPKFEKLKEIMLDHFQRAKQTGQDTRAIVFCEYRESVSLVHCLLLQCRPLIVPLMFVGQGASGNNKAVTSQKQQLRAMRSFRAGAGNALVCTCVGEEGLDVGSVDLILCFDISTRSPVRLVQRCGRTGRERGGQVFILVTEGREHQTLIDCMRQRDGLNNKILHSKEVENNLYKANPRMIPHDFMPECQKMHITVKKDAITSEKPKKGQKDIKSMLKRASASNSSTYDPRSSENNDLISEDDFKNIFPNGFEVVQRIGPSMELWCKSKETIKELSKKESSGIKLHTWLEWQRSLQKTINIGHSIDSEILTSLLKCSDDKRFEAAPSTQNPSFNTQDFATQNVIKPVSSPAKANNKQSKKKAKVPLIKSPTKRDGDIRALFSTATKSTKNYTKLLHDLGIPNNGKVSTTLINLLVDLNLELSSNVRKCFICSNICDCKFMKHIESKNSPILFLNSTSLKLPDLHLIDDFDTESILKCGKNTIEELSQEPKDVNNITVGDQSKNFDLEFDFDLSNSPVLEKETVIDDKVDTNFDIGDIEDIFEKSSPEENNEIEIDKTENPKDRLGFEKSSPEEDDKIEMETTENPKDTLGFFGLDSIDDIFADSDDEPTTDVQQNDITKNNVPKDTDAIEIGSDDEIILANKAEPDVTTRHNEEYIVKSPSLLSGRLKTDSIPTSPILCSQPRKFQLSTKKKHLETSTPMSSAKKKLILDPTPIENTKLCAERAANISKSLNQNVTAETSNKSMFTITQLVEMINSTSNSSIQKSHLELDSKNRSNLNERSSSPILLTQAERGKKSYKNNKINNSETPKRESLIILDSDSDSNDETQEYNLTNFKDSFDLKEDSSPILSCKEPAQNNNKLIDKNEKIEGKTNNLLNDIQNSPPRVKRKLEDDDEIVASPYFSKKQKTDGTSAKPLTLREKVLAALSSNKFDISTDDDLNVNYLHHSPKFISQKENKDPSCYVKNNLSDDDKPANKLEILQKFRKESTRTPRKNNFLNSPKKNNALKADLTFADSDDDFVGTDCNFKSQKRKTNNTKSSKRKVRKKKSAAEEFLDLEAEVSSEEDSDSASDSEDSLRSFLCDENVDSGDIAHYLQSIKSPVKGVFKIPELPKKFNKEEILSQYVGEDSYEMDSFCVDSHIGLTQVNDISELELAEMRLEERRRKRKAPTHNITLNNTESPIVRKTVKKARRIESDSDDSS